MSKEINNKSTGWFKLYRSLFDDPVWTCSNPAYKVVLITLLGMVNFEHREWEFDGKKYSLEPGQTVTSLKSIAELAGDGVTEGQVRGALKRFEKLDFLTSKSTNKNRLITVKNWRKYQATEIEGNKQTYRQPTSNLQATYRQPTGNLQLIRMIRMK